MNFTKQLSTLLVGSPSSKQSKLTSPGTEISSPIKIEADISSDVENSGGFRLFGNTSTKREQTNKPAVARRRVSSSDIGYLENQVRVC